MNSGTYAQAANTAIILTGGLRPSQVFWQIAGTVDVGSGSGGASFQGIILAKTQVTLTTGSTMTGRILSQTGIALQMSTVLQPDDSDSNCANTTVTTTTTTTASVTRTVGGKQAFSKKHFSCASLT